MSSEHNKVHWAQGKLYFGIFVLVVTKYPRFEDVTIILYVFLSIVEFSYRGLELSYTFVPKPLHLQICSMASESDMNRIKQVRTE